MKQFSGFFFLLFLTLEAFCSSRPVHTLSLGTAVSDSIIEKENNVRNNPATLSALTGSISLAVTGVSIMTYLSGFGLVFGMLGIFAVVMGIKGLIRHKKLVKSYSATHSQVCSLGMGKSIVGILLGTIGTTILGLMVAFYLSF